MLLGSLRKEYGAFTRQPDGRMVGHVLAINGQRKDGRFSATHCFGSGARINKIYSAEQLALEIEKLQTP